MITTLTGTDSIVNEYLRQLRDKEIQRDRQRFEHNLEMLGVIAGYELSKRLTYVANQVQTPLGIAEIPLITDKIVISTVLRAGLPLHRGICKVLPDAEPAFIAAGRKPDTSDGVKINLAYVAGPDITGKVLVIADTMLATGHTFVEAYQALTTMHGTPAKLFVIAVIASQSGIDYITEQLPDAEIIVCAVDPILNDDYFIVPGLGDAGDLLYGPKL